MRNAGLDETQAGIKTAGRKTNNLRYADDTTLIAESKEEPKEPLDKGESEKAGLKLNTQKTKIKASGSITLWQIDGETVETVVNFIFFFLLQNHCRWWLQLAPWKKNYDQPRQHIKKQVHYFADKVSSSQRYGFFQ